PGRRQGGSVLLYWQGGVEDAVLSAGADVVDGAISAGDEHHAKRGPDAVPRPDRRGHRKASELGHGCGAGRRGWGELHEDRFVVVPSKEVGAVVHGGKPHQGGRTVA